MKRSSVLIAGLIAVSVSAPLSPLAAQELPKPTYENSIIVSIEHNPYDTAEIDYIKSNFSFGLYAWPSFSVTALVPELAWISDWTQADTGIAAFQSSVDGLIAAAKAKGVRLHLVVISGLARGLSVYAEAKTEDIRNAQWFNDNNLGSAEHVASPSAMTGYIFGTFSRYARKIRANLEAKGRAMMNFLKRRMDENPEVLVAVSGWGEAEMNYWRNDYAKIYPDWICDYSPFAVLEFRDWIAHEGLYDDVSGLYKGQGWAAGGAQYRGSSGLARFNADFGTSFTSWDLKYHNWSLADDWDAVPQDGVNADPHRIPWSSYTQGGMMPSSGPAYIAGGFDPPRVLTIGNPFWTLWNTFRETMVHVFVREAAEWAHDAGIPADRWYSHQIPGDYLWGTKPSDSVLNTRYYSSASPLWTADITPFGSMGATIYDVKFPIPGSPGEYYFARTSQYVLPVISAMSSNWAAMEYNPEAIPAGLGVPESTPEFILDQYLRIYGYRPHLLNFWRWIETPEHQIKGRNKETALREFIRRVRDKSRATDLSTVYSPPKVVGLTGAYGPLSAAALLPGVSAPPKTPAIVSSGWAKGVRPKTDQAPVKPAVFPWAAAEFSINRLPSVINRIQIRKNPLSAENHNSVSSLPTTTPPPSSPTTSPAAGIDAETKRGDFQTLAAVVHLQVTGKIWDGESWNWKDWGDFHHFEVFRGASADFAADAAHSIGTTTEYSYHDAAIGYGVVYYYKWQAVNGNGVKGPASDAVMVATTTTTMPVLTLSKTTLVFGQTVGGTAGAAQTILVKNIGAAGTTLAWRADSDQSWLLVSPANGTGSGILQITVNGTGLGEGTYSGKITVNDPLAVNAPQDIGVRFKVFSAGGDEYPFGSFDTPINGANVASSIPVTGWAIDDVAVDNVKIKRRPGAGDPPGIVDADGLIYIGDAVFVKGARPDVEAAHTDYPRADSAGWGYMLLTNFLPNLGNGVFTLVAVVHDVSGHRRVLGERTIQVDNVHALKPFGAIDTPTQGGLASGNIFTNFGWVLTPLPNSIPADGSTITVWVDSLPLGHPSYGHYRSDIATLFPGYADSNGAVGYSYLDTTGYSNGVHTIAWSVSDSAGNDDGIGSRFFEIQNAGAAARTLQAAVAVNEALLPEDFSGGLAIGTAASSEIEIEELGRVKIGLSGTPGSRIIGWGPTEDKPLPIGSTLDPEGTFWWSAGPGFLGRHVLHFAATDGISRGPAVEIVVQIVPKGKKRIE